jgi:hypothetical protein
MESKYKIGQKVRVKSIDWYHHNKDTFGGVCVGDKKPKFTYGMSKYCGLVLTIDDHSEYEGEYYMIEDDGVYTWTDEMFEGVVDDHQYHPDMSGQYHSDSELDNIDKYIQRRFDGNGCQIALPEGYQFVDRQGNVVDTSIIIVQKKGVEYPKDYDECCYVLDDNDKMSLEVMNELRKLVNARNAYWKLYGKANGLGGSWKPDWEDGCYVIFTNGDGLIKMDIQFGLNAILAFPTAELRDMFYERFKSEIELCKEFI